MTDKRKKILITLAVIVPTWMATIDSAIVNIGFGTIAGNIGASIDEIAWISTSYLLAMLTTLPLAGWLSANFGRRRTFICALGVFTLASIACAMSDSLATLTIARFIQGLGAGVIMPLSSAALMDAYGIEERTKAFKIFGICAMAGPAVGPSLGGWLLANGPWQSMFLINVPLGLAALALALNHIPNQSIPGEKSKFDWLGLGIMSLGFCSMQYALQQGPREEWLASWDIVASIILTCSALGWFGLREWKAEKPFVNLRPLRVPAYGIGIALAMITGIGVTGTEFVVPLYMQDVLHFDLATIGLCLMASPIAAMIGMEAAGRLMRTIPSPVIAIASLLITATGTFWMAVMGTGVEPIQIVAPRALMGLGIGLMYVPLATLINAKIPKADLDAAAGLSNLSRQLGMSLGFAFFGSLVFRTQTSTTSELAAKYGVRSDAPNPTFDTVKRVLVEHGWTQNDAASGAIRAMHEALTHAATNAAYGNILLVVGFIFVLSIPGVALFRTLPSSIKERPAS